MTKKVMEASHAIAEAIKMIEPDVIAAYPITPQTHIVERLSDFVADGELKSQYINVDSEFSALSACIGASATGCRAYSSTSSQGLALMFELLFITSGMRLPVCMSEVNRALSAPINIWNDHQDAISCRDSGWLQFYVETGQEAFDLSLMQFKISEDKDVLLPSMVCMDGFTLSHVYEPVDITTKKLVEDFVPRYKPVHAVLDPEQPLTQGPIGFPSEYMEIRYAQCAALNNSIKTIEKVFKGFSDKFPVQIKNSRPERYYHVEEYQLHDAEIAFVAMGSMCGTIKDVVDRLRNRGEKVGLLKLITYRPFPKDAIKKSLKGIKKIAVLEKAISPGVGGVLCDEIAGVLYKTDTQPDIRSFIVGFGGRDVKLDHIEKIYEMTKNDKGSKEEWMF